MSCQRVTTMLCAMFSVSGMLLGILPVRDWPHDPRPWPAALAWVYMIAVAQYQNVNGGLLLLATNSTDIFKIAITLYHALCRSLEGWEKCRQRVALCALVRCLRLYCAAHPLSAAGWRTVMLPVLVCSFHVGDSIVTGRWWTANACRSAAWLRSTMKRDIFSTVGWGFYTGTMHMFALGLPSLTGELARELRLDCERAIRRATGRGLGVPDDDDDATRRAVHDPVNEVLAWAAGPPAPREARRGRIGNPLDQHTWRWLRLRHMVILDMSRMTFSLMRYQVLIILIFTFTYVTTSISTVIGSIVDAGSRDHVNFFVCLASPLHAAIERVVLFAYASFIFERTAREVQGADKVLCARQQGKLCHDLEGYLAQSPCVPGAVAREVKEFILQIVLHDGCCELFGMFRVDLGVFKTVVAAITTYLVVLVQFRVSLY
ncbi:Gustatory and odorant receptor 24 [Frankliniella fusca]|uniref:Gustatory receptor n=1 Tax=Frankliniella fusca TaxID=407009 RepID=A0AAE1I5P1_9NEOP|nr:Gustatory and odorant receptor 24 [Frankliniella fusca]